MCKADGKKVKYCYLEQIYVNFFQMSPNKVYFNQKVSRQVK